MRSLLILSLLFVSVFAQDPSQLVLTSTLSGGEEVQISFTATALADQTPVKNSFQISALNFVAFNVPSSVVHRHPPYPRPLDECELRNLRESSPDIAPFYEPQTIGFSVGANRLTWDTTGNVKLTATAKTTYDLYNHVNPTNNLCNRDHEDCDVEDHKYTTVSIVLSLTSPSTGGIASDLQTIVRGGRRNVTTTLPPWTWDYNITSGLSSNDTRKNLTNFNLIPSRTAKATYKFEGQAVIDSIRAPFFYTYRNLKIQPIGIDTTKVICFGVPCTPILLPDLNPTGLKGLNFGRPQADAQWKKASVTFTWLPLITVKDGSFKVLADKAEDNLFKSQYTSATALEIFFAYSFTPSGNHGGGYCSGVGSANAKILTTEYQVDNCGVDVTHLAHEIGHALGLWHPQDPANSPDGSTNTLMCGSGNCRDNPKRNSKANQDNLSNPLLTFKFSTSAPTADDCQNDVDCDVCFAPA